ncbi:MAG TPA: acyl-CoA dehydrogenase family protein [Candidatus Binataceae bacterium]|nr:acyl-CoA dehydrogenase family protein [Candidatus Binataceae bacterium]
MDFGFSSEQEMLRQSARRFLSEQCPISLVRRMMADPTALDPALWTQLVELGWTGLLIPEAYGGSGGSFLDLTVVLEQAGYALMPGPFFTAVLLGTPALAAAGTPTQQAQLLPACAAGQSIVSWAIAEAPTALYEPAAIQMRARADAGGWVMSGHKLMVWDAQVAQTLVVAARSTAGQGQEGISLFLVPTQTTGVTITPQPSIDSTRKLCAVTLNDVAVGEAALLGPRDGGWPVIRRSLELATAGLCAELVGVAQRALDLSVAYAKTRVQFGHPIGAFQAIKHKCVDMLMMVENARSLTYYACWALAEQRPDAGAAVAMAKAYASDTAKNVTSEAIQIHGGIGFTWAHDIQLFHRRALAGEANFGNAPLHREAVAKALSL